MFHRPLYRSWVLALVILVLASASPVRSQTSLPVVGRIANPARATTGASGTGTIAGHVSNRWGGPVEARVEIHDLQGQEVDWSWAGQGQYETQPLPTGDYIVQFDGSSDGCASEYYNDQPNFVTADRVRVTENQVTDGIDAILTCNGAVTGKVTSERTGEPLSYIDVVATDATGTERREAETDFDGVYILTNLSPGPHRIFFNEQSAFLEERNPYLSEYYNNRPDLASADVVEVPYDTLVTGIDAALGQSGQIAGHVAQHTNPYRREGSVAAIDEAGNVVGLAYPSSDDAYVINGLATGKYRVWFEGTGQELSEYYNHKLTLADADLVDVVLGEVTAGIDATLLKRPSEVWVGTSTALPGTLVVSPEGPAPPAYSLDGGMTWRNFATIPAREPGRPRPQVAVIPGPDAAHPRRFIMTAPENPFTRDGEDVGIYRSDDDGQSWVRYLIETTCSSRAYPLLAAAPADPRRLYVVQSAQCFSGKQEWQEFTTFTSSGAVTWEQTALHKYTEYTLVLSPLLPGRIYGWWYADYAEWWHVSDDNGQTVARVAFPVTFLQPDWTNSAVLYGVYADPPFDVFQHYVGRRSTDGGSTWGDWAQQPCSSSFEQLLALPTPAHTLLLRCAQGLYRSQNGGDAWEKLSADRGGALSVDYGMRDRVFWTRDNDLWVSRDAGSTWTKLGDWQAQSTFVPVVRR